ncbi:hypothetical protein FXO38_35437 [Capsicum annuum]|nr:hypothetical protein FXO38_35437 [Capsicum annuum]
MYAQDRGEVVLDLRFTVCREDYFGFMKVDSLTRMRAEVLEDPINASLAGANDYCQEGFYPRSDDLGGDFVLGVTKAYGYKVLERGSIPSIPALRNEAEEVMVKGAYGAQGGGVGLGSPVSYGVISGIEINIVIRDSVGYLLRVMLSCTTFINEGVDPISPPPIKSRGVKESCVGVTLREPRYSRLDLPELSL